MGEALQNVLTPEVIFTPPGLRPALPTHFKFSPCGLYVTYLKGSTDEPTTLDLWRFDRANREHSPVLLAQELNAQADESVTLLSDAERAERERKRQFTFGISHYQWIGEGNSIAVYADGHAYVIPDGIDPEDLIRVTPKTHRNSGFNPSVSGTLMSYVRAGNLYYKYIESPAEEINVTGDADEFVTYGLPDFLAAEEMHRFAGAWWSKCERYLIYCRNDDGPVRVSHRMEIDGNGSRTIPQRYPYAGETNPAVSLHIFDTHTKDNTEIWRTNESLGNAYLARVNPVEDGICIQIQDRLQQSLTLSFYHFDQRTWQERYREDCDSWINLTDDFHELSDGSLLFSTEAEDSRKAILIALDGDTRFLSGPKHINQIHKVSDGYVFATGWDQTPIDNHFFEIALDGSGYRQITKKEGVHDVVVHSRLPLFIDRLTNPKTPARIAACELNSDSDEVIFEEVITAAHRYAPYAEHHVTARFGTVESKGHQLHYRLTPPVNASKDHPTIVYVYGGPGAQKTRRDWGTLLVQLFAQRGYGVLELDNRGSANRGRRFEAGLYKSMGKIEVDDQLLGTQILAGESWANPDRIGVFGHSYGGYMTLMCLCQAGHRFKAGAAVAPVADWRLYDSHYTERFMGLPADNKGAYHASSVITHLAQLERPLLLMHGMADDNVLFTHSTMLMSELQKLGKPFELMTYPGAKHSMQESHISIHRFTTILNFFDRVL